MNPSPFLCLGLAAFSALSGELCEWTGRRRAGMLMFALAAAWLLWALRGLIA